MMFEPAFTALMFGATTHVVNEATYHDEQKDELSWKHIAGKTSVTWNNVGGVPVGKDKPRICRSIKKMVSDHKVYDNIEKYLPGESAAASDLDSNLKASFSWLGDQMTRETAMAYWNHATRSNPVKTIIVSKVA
jgi:hypothetical protein